MGNAADSMVAYILLLGVVPTLQVSDDEHEMHAAQTVLH